MAARTKNQTSASKPATGYTVLARRYRSRDFDELIGQEPIALTLQNAIKSNRTAHAYLFCGTRGVGKTSMARIFAKALNATDDLKEKKEIGEAILRGDDLDVIEIDAASNRGIDNARDLIAGASLSPARCPYKIYVIDEVHQLTKDAFNALLKTMEEPPKHVKFILCTTEPQKVPATIQSRCQRFDFRAIPSTKIAEQLKHILKEEGIKADDEVIAQVARLGNGSMRDALSIMDRLLAGAEAKLTMEVVEQMLGLPDHTLVTELIDAVIACDAAAAMNRGSELIARGATVDQALEMITEHLRTLMVIAACGDDSEILDLADESRTAAAAQAKHFDAPALVHMIAICDAVARNARTSAASRALFDAAIVRLAMSQHFADITGLLAGKPLPARSASNLPGKPASRPALTAADSKKKDQPLVDESLDSEPPSPPQREREQALTEIKPITDDQLWPRVLEAAQQSIPDRQRTEHLVFNSFDGRTLRLSLDESGADVVRYLSNNTDKIVDLVKRATGRQVLVELDTSRFDVGGSGVKPQALVGDQNQAPRPAIVDKALDLFDAVIVSVDNVGSSERNPAG